MWLFLLAVLVVAFLQAVFLPFHLALLTVVMVSLRRQEEMWIWLFASGFLFDLVVGLPVGFSSLLFLIAGTLVWQVKETGYESIVATGLIFLGALATSFLETSVWQWQSALVTMALGLVIWVLGQWGGAWQKAKGLEL